MTNPPQSARTFTEWWTAAYAWEHRLIGVLVGLLLGALILPPMRGISAMRTLQDQASMCSADPAGAQNR